MTIREQKRPSDQDFESSQTAEELPPIVEKALKMAQAKHEGQFRKTDTPMPFISHPIEVEELVARFGGDDDTRAAALLHDILEDTDYTPEELEKDFGPQIARIVQEVTEQEEKGPDPRDSWQPRKESYLRNLQDDSEPALLICAADKIHNLSSLIREYQEQGEALWEKFNAPKEKKLWYYGEVLKILQERLDNLIVRELAQLYKKANEVFV
ncbi:HD domain-containing protein [Patescibacteria group bacterium]|nr:HD domain-containing protein [Patescibacteria group bacterium]